MTPMTRRSTGHAFIDAWNGEREINSQDTKLL